MFALDDKMKMRMVEEDHCVVFTNFVIVGERCERCENGTYEVFHS